MLSHSLLLLHSLSTNDELTDLLWLLLWSSIAVFFLVVSPNEHNTSESWMCVRTLKDQRVIYIWTCSLEYEFWSLIQFSWSWEFHSRSLELEQDPLCSASARSQCQMCIRLDNARLTSDFLYARQEIVTIQKNIVIKIRRYEQKIKSGKLSYSIP